MTDDIKQIFDKLVEQGWESTQNGTRLTRRTPGESTAEDAHIQWYDYHFMLSDEFEENVWAESNVFSYGAQIRYKGLKDFVYLDKMLSDPIPKKHTVTSFIGRTDKQEIFYDEASAREKFAELTRQIAEKVQPTTK